MPDSDAALQRVKRLDANDTLQNNIVSRIRAPWFNDELWGHEWYLVSH